MNVKEKFTVCIGWMIDDSDHYVWDIVDIFDTMDQARAYVKYVFETSLKHYDSYQISPTKNLGS